MQKKKCTGCGEDVGFKADNCPHCGQVLKKKQENPALAAIIVIIIASVAYNWLFK